MQLHQAQNVVSLDQTNDTLDSLRLIEFCEIQYKVLLDDFIHCVDCSQSWI